MKVRVVNQRSDRWGHVGTAAESSWGSNSLLVQVTIGGQRCQLFRWNLEAC